MKYSPSHEWIRIENDIGTIGITAYAQKELGEVVYIELPKVGSTVRLGDEICVLESTKAAADVYSPVSGKVTQVNEQLKDKLELLNQAPENEGWLFKIALDDPKEVDQMLDLKGYKALTE